MQALRLWVTLLVVAFHAAIAYATVPLVTTIWVVYDGSSSRAFDVALAWGNGFMMPLFMLLAGVSAARGCEAKSVADFLKHRARRLLRPLAIGCLIVLPPTYLVWAYGLLVTERCDMSNLLRLRFSADIQRQLVGPGHLWFLEYLFLICSGWCLGQELLGPLVKRVVGRFEGLLSGPFKPLVWALPTCLIFAADPDAMRRIGNSFLPDLPRLAHYGVFFAAGVWIANAPDPKRLLLRGSLFYAASSLAVFAALAPLVRRHLDAPLASGERVALAVLAAAFAWLTSFGMLGLFVRWFDRGAAWLRYPSEASLWVYLFHLPLVALSQVVLLPLAWPAGAKFAVVVVASLSASLLSYEYMVRYSLIGELVNGTRKKGTASGKKRNVEAATLRGGNLRRLRPELGWIAAAAAMLVLAATGAWRLRDFLFHDNFHVVLAGDVFRSARLTPRKLDEAIARHGLRAVLSVCGGSDAQDWFVNQRAMCESRGVAVYSLDLKPDRLPSPEVLRLLIETIDSAPRPLLIEGKWGISRAGFGSAIAMLLAGRSPDEAMGQFDSVYGQIGGAEHVALAGVVRSYQAWLTDGWQVHRADRFLAWSRLPHVPRVETQFIAAHGERRQSLIGSPRFSTQWR
jgi:hypothetical protein